MAVVGTETHQKLSGISAGNLEVLEEAVGLRELNREGSGLDGRDCLSMRKGRRSDATPQTPSPLLRAAAVGGGAYAMGRHRARRQELKSLRRSELDLSLLHRLKTPYLAPGRARSPWERAPRRDRLDRRRQRSSPSISIIRDGPLLAHGCSEAGAGAGTSARHRYWAAERGLRGGRSRRRGRSGRWRRG